MIVGRLIDDVLGVVGVLKSFGVKIFCFGIGSFIERI